MRGWPAALPFAAAALVLVGCGGDDDNGLSKSEYIKQGNAICTKGNAVIDKAARQQFQAQPTPAQFAAFAKSTLIPTISGEIDDLKALKAPKDDADELSQLYDDAEAALDKIKANPALAGAEGANDPFADVNKRATAYGLTVCGSP
jgi:hypothetical protein